MFVPLFYDAEEDKKALEEATAELKPLTDYIKKVLGSCLAAAGADALPVCMAGNHAFLPRRPPFSALHLLLSSCTSASMPVGHPNRLADPAPCTAAIFCTAGSGRQGGEGGGDEPAHRLPRRRCGLQVRLVGQHGAHHAVAGAPLLYRWCAAGMLRVYCLPSQRRCAAEALLRWSRGTAAEPLRRQRHQSGSGGVTITRCV